MKYIIAIDQSTSASKALLVDESGAIVRRASLAHKQYYPAPGRVEHDAQEIWRNVEAIIAAVSEGISFDKVACISISNQRETTVVWDAKTGEPVCPAIVWQDVRGEAACRELAEHAEYIRRATGLRLSPYFPAGKLRALFQENPEIRRRAADGDLKLGTMDSYLVYRMTGGKHVTDTTNASRTQLMNLEGLNWDDDLFQLFGIPKCAMPGSILHADDDFGVYRGVPITGVLGDSHAALYGQGCHQPGMAKATYGTGSSVMMNVGRTPVISREGLSASVAFSVGDETSYAVEGNVTCSGDTLVWLCDTLGLFESPDQIEQLAATVNDAQGVNLIPAFAGLGTPYFDSDARAILCGMSRGTGKAHIAYAALASIAQQDADILEIMQRESGYTADRLFADGGPTRNAILMQIQADYAGCTICCTPASERSALGAAFIGGVKTGVFRSFEEITAWSPSGRIYEPRISETERKEKRAAWKMAVCRALTTR